MILLSQILITLGITSVIFYSLSDRTQHMDWSLIFHVNTASSYSSQYVCWLILGWHNFIIICYPLASHVTNTSCWYREPRAMLSTHHNVWKLILKTTLSIHFPPHCIRNCWVKRCCQLPSIWEMLSLLWYCVYMTMVWLL